jgi:flagellar basal-body rod protein FlgF
MIDALSMTAQSMSVDLQRVLAVSQNMAHAGTPAYKSLMTVVRPFESYLPAAAGDALPSMGLELQTMTDRSPGTIRPTGNWSDLAIEGPGYFEFQGANGMVYGRRGDFTLDAQGRLVSQDGLPVMSVGGVTTLSGSNASINAEGLIYEAERNVGQIKVVKIDNPESMWVGADGYLHGNDQTRVTEERSPIRQGFLENSNVNSAREMVRLMETIRHFESGQKVIQSYDEMLGKSLGKFAEL